MALWGDKDNISVGTGATAYISSYTKNETYGGYPVVGSGSVWGSAGYAQEGDVIRFGNVGNSVAGAGGTYYGEAIIVDIQSTTQYETGVGWVGVQTYIDSGSNLRVKKEILVSMSGIATGNAPIYDSNPTA
jgi:hypothetical protein